MNQQQPSEKRTPSNPAIAELQAIRQELGKLRQDFNSQNEPSPSKVDPEVSFSRESTILKVGLWLCGFMSFYFCKSAGSEMTGLKSIAGGTLAEMYYQSMGTFATGLSFFLAGTLFYFGYLVPPVGFSTRPKQKNITTTDAMKRR